LNEDICEHIAKQTNLYDQQKVNERIQFNNMKKRSQDKDQVPANKNEMQLHFEILNKSLK
jgi:hypothetical protein